MNQEEKEVLNYIATFTYHVKEVDEKGMTTGHTATLPLKYLIAHFILKYPNIRQILKNLRGQKLITGYEFPVGNKKGKVRATNKASLMMPITSQRRDMRRFIRWKNGEPSLENDYTFYPEYMRERIKKEEESKL